MPKPYDNADMAEQKHAKTQDIRHSIIQSLLDHARQNGGSIEPHKLVDQAKALSAWIMNGTMPKEPPVS